MINNLASIKAGLALVMFDLLVGVDLGATFGGDMALCATSAYTRHRNSRCLYWFIAAWSPIAALLALAAVIR